MTASPKPSPSSAPTLPMPHYLEYLEEDILALVGVAAGFKASLTLSTCCLDLRISIASPVVDEQLFGCLYALSAGVEDPRYALLRPRPSPQPSSSQKDRRIVQNTAPRHHHHHHHRSHDEPARSSPFQVLPTRRSPLNLEPPAMKRGRRHCRSSSVGVAESTVREEVSPDNNCPATSTPPLGPFPLSGDSGAGLRGCAMPDSESRCPEAPCFWMPERVRSRGERLPSPLRRNAVVWDDGRGRAVAPTSVDSASPVPLSVPVPTKKSSRSNRCERIQTWKGRLKRDLATEREPTETFAFSGQRVGKQDVLMAVVPSSPFAIAVTCTTELSLFQLDGTRLPPVATRCITKDLSRAGDAAIEGARVYDRQAAVVAEQAHERDIRCLAASPMGDMVATGSLDCTIRVRSVPACDWVRRLRGHEAGVRCLTFHGARLVSADSLGVLSVWDVFPIARRLQVVRGHSDSVQVLTWTGGGERLASGALDGSVMVWSVSSKGGLTPTVACGGLCLPYRLVAVGRCLVFTSSAAPRVQTLASGDDATACPLVGSNPPSTTSKMYDVSVVDVLGRFGQRVCTGQARVQHLAAGACFGMVMVSPAEPWAYRSDDSSEEDDEAFILPDLRGVSSRDYAPRLCRIAGAGSACRMSEKVVAGRVDRNAGGSSDRGQFYGKGRARRSESALLSEWVKMSQCRASSAQQRTTKSCEKRDGERNTDDTGSDLEGSSGGALCTCAAFVGRTVFLGYDTGGVWAHRGSDGNRLYRLSAHGPVVHLVEAEGSLFAYASSGMVSRWTWGD